MLDLLFLSMGVLQKSSWAQTRVPLVSLIVLAGYLGAQKNGIGSQALQQVQVSAVKQITHFFFLDDVLKFKLVQG